jgi:hypothetical protein
MRVFAGDVHLERIPRDLIQAVIVDPKGSWI